MAPRRAAAQTPQSVVPSPAPQAAWGPAPQQSNPYAPQLRENALTPAAPTLGDMQQAEGVLASRPYWPRPDGVSKGQYAPPEMVAPEVTEDAMRRLAAVKTVRGILGTRTPSAIEYLTGHFGPSTVGDPNAYAAAEQSAVAPLVTEQAKVANENQIRSAYNETTRSDYAQQYGLAALTAAERASQGFTNAQRQFQGEQNKQKLESAEQIASERNASAEKVGAHHDWASIKVGAGHDAVAAARNNVMLSLMGLKRNDTRLGRLTDQVTGKGDPTYTQLEQKAIQADRLRALASDQAGGVRNLTDTEQAEFAAGVASLLKTGGAPAQALIHSFMPKTMTGDVEKISQWWLNEPRGLDQQAFTLRVLGLADREQKTIREQSHAHVVRKLTEHFAPGGVLSDDADPSTRSVAEEILRTSGIEPEEAALQKVGAPPKKRVQIVGQPFEQSTKPAQAAAQAPMQGKRPTRTVNGETREWDGKAWVKP